MKKRRVRDWLVGIGIVVLMGCETTDEVLDDRRTIATNIALFLAGTEGEAGLEFSNVLEPITIKVGESVVFKNDSNINIEVFRVTSNEGTEFFSLLEASTEDYVGSQTWTFEGGNPDISNENMVTVVYSEEGIFPVKLQIDDAAEESETIIREDYVTVIADDTNTEESLCLIESEESDDGRSAEFTYVQTDNGWVVQRVDNYLSDVLQEYALYFYNAGDQVQVDRVEFYSFGDVQIGVSQRFYNATGQLIRETREDADTNKFFEIGFEYDPGFSASMPTGGYVEEPDGAGGFVTTDFTYSLDSEGINVSRVDFTRDGTALGYVNREYETHAKAFTNLSYTQSYPEAFNANSIKLETTFDALDNLISSATYTYEFTAADDCAELPTGVEINRDGETTRRDFVLFLSGI